MNVSVKMSEMLQAVMAIDLNPIKLKLMHVASGEGWSVERTDAVEKEYRRFLCLMKLYPEEDTAPLVDVDTFWHYHILDTMKYAADCEQAFGYFLHHYPYVGLRGGDDAQFRVDSGERMRTLYETTFGESYPTASWPTAAAAMDYRTGFVQLAGGALTAWCAGPAAQQAAGAATAWCAGPAGKQAGKQTVSAAATAWCAGPAASQAANAATAWCAGPAGKQAVNTAATAWCAGPAAKQAANAATAWCAGPAIRPASHEAQLAA
jgi:hypothetical protein